MEPEIKLWLAVLERAVRDAELLLDRAKADASVIDKHIFYQEYLSLCRYFRSRTNRVGGVQWICELFDLHPDNVSARVERDCFVPLANMIKMRRKQKRLLEILQNRISILGGSEIVEGSNIASDGSTKNNDEFIRTAKGEKNV
ncbi:MAG: hypothetical protein H7839_18980 [Magnetococcus sp. YQC-5]